MLGIFIVLHGLKMWKDSNLGWNESEYGNLNNIRLPPNHIWKPDILMYNRYVLLE